MSEVEAACVKHARAVLCSATGIPTAAATCSGCGKCLPFVHRKSARAANLRAGGASPLAAGGTILGAESRKFAGFSVWPVLRPRCLTDLQIGDLCNDPTPEIRLMFFNSIDRTGLLRNRKSPRQETAPRPSTRSGNALIPREGCDFFVSCKVHFLWFSRSLYSLSLVWRTLPCRRSRHRANLHVSSISGSPQARSCSYPWFTWLTVNGLRARRQLRTDLAELLALDCREASRRILDSSETPCSDS